MRLAHLCIALALAAGAIAQARGQPATSQPAAKPVRVLILTGQGEHDWRTSAPFLRQVLAGTGRFDVRVCETPAGLTARTLAEFDVVVDDCAGQPRDADTAKAIHAFVASGKGVVLTHAAVGAPQAWMPQFAKAFGPSNGSTARLSTVEFAEVKLDRPEHRIVKGLPASFKIADRLYRGMSIGPEADVIATANNDPVLFTFPCGKGRVFCTAMGADLAAMHASEFITTFARGIEWAAGGEVTLPADVGLPQPAADAVRILLITGGHDHEAAFYSTFDGYNDLAWTPVASSPMAFQKDFRDKCDVLVLYDFTRDLDDAAKKNLRDFVESGNKGLVVLHHALLSYQAWPWWYREVVGGSYRLAPDGKMPPSTYKAEQQMFITPHEHPITAGIAPFRLTDETYKRMWISPDVRPLLTTDNPNSDATIAWVSPYAKSKVVYIQLGHGRGSFFHPSYRAIVHNAILWTAGRLK